MSLRLFNRIPQLTLSPGMYQYDLKQADSSARIHLRVDEDLSGLLIVNAAKVVHLNPSAVIMAYLHLQGQDKVAIKTLKKIFNANDSELAQDFSDIVFKIDALTDQNSDLCPVCDLDLSMQMPFTAKLSAPYRMDLAITYRCNNACAHCYNARSRNHPELDTLTWQKIIDKIWELRIPHVVFTGGEPTLREDLVELVAYAQNKGLVTGLNTNGRKLSDKHLLDRLISAGLDHVQITLESEDPAIHDEMVCMTGAWQETVAGLRNVVKSKLYMMTNSTLLTNNIPSLTALLHFLAVEKVPVIGLNALIYSGRGKTVSTGLKEESLPDLLEIARTFTRESGQRLIWYTPTQYCHFDPLQLDLGIKGCTAAYYNMCIESDGQVIPCQSYYESLGNFLDSDWDSIWNHPLSVNLRERRNVPQGCKTCDLFNVCGGGCPLARDHQTIQPVHKELLINRS